MNSMPQCQTNRAENDGGHFLTQWIRSHWTQIIESSWCCLTFILFLLLGPFSVVAVLIGLGSLANEERRERMIEPARL